MGVETIVQSHQMGLRLRVFEINPGYKEASFSGSHHDFLQRANSELLVGECNVTPEVGQDDYRLGSIEANLGAIVIDGLYSDSNKTIVLMANIKGTQYTTKPLDLRNDITIVAADHTNQDLRRTIDSYWHEYELIDYRKRPPGARERLQQLDRRKLLVKQLLGSRDRAKPHLYKDSGFSYLQTITTPGESYSFPGRSGSRMPSLIEDPGFTRFSYYFGSVRIAAGLRTLRQTTHTRTS